MHRIWVLYLSLLVLAKILNPLLLLCRRCNSLEINSAQYGVFVLQMVTDGYVFRYTHAQGHAYNPHLGKLRQILRVTLLKPVTWFYSPVAELIRWLGTPKTARGRSLGPNKTGPN